MNQREYPCIVLSNCIFDYALEFYKTPALSFTVYTSEIYQQIAERGLKNSFEIKVPFYNEVQS